MPTPPKRRSWDDYYVPGTQTLRNRFVSNDPSIQTPYGISDYAVVDRLTEQASHRRLVQLYGNPVLGRFDRKHMEKIHEHIFQDCYDWAGQARTAPEGGMSKDGHVYYPGDKRMIDRLDDLYGMLAGDNYLQGLDQGTFPEALGAYWGHINTAHEFREGNTRSQFVFFSGLCDQAGYELSTEMFKPGNPLRDQFVQARYTAQDTGRTGPLAAVLSQGIVPKLQPDRALDRLADWEPAPPPTRTQRAVNFVTGRTSMTELMERQNAAALNAAAARARVIPSGLSMEFDQQSDQGLERS